MPYGVTQRGTVNRYQINTPQSAPQSAPKSRYRWPCQPTDSWPQHRNTHAVPKYLDLQKAVWIVGCACAQLVEDVEVTTAGMTLTMHPTRVQQAASELHIPMRVAVPPQ